MQKEELLKTIILISVLLVIVIVHFSYGEQTNNIDTHNYGKETVMFNQYNSIEYYTNETLVLIPPDWLLNISNTSINKSFEKSHYE